MERTSKLRKPQIVLRTSSSKEEFDSGIVKTDFVSKGEDNVLSDSGEIAELLNSSDTEVAKSPEHRLIESSARIEEIEDRARRLNLTFSPTPKFIPKEPINLESYHSRESKGSQGDMRRWLISEAEETSHSLLNLQTKYALMVLETTVKKWRLKRLFFAWNRFTCNFELNVEKDMQEKQHKLELLEQKDRFENILETKIHALEDSHRTLLETQKSIYENTLQHQKELNQNMSTQAIQSALQSQRESQNNTMISELKARDMSHSAVLKSQRNTHSIILETQLQAQKDDFESKINTLNRQKNEIEKSYVMKLQKCVEDDKAKHTIQMNKQKEQFEESISNYIAWGIVESRRHASGLVQKMLQQFRIQELVELRRGELEHHEKSRKIDKCHQTDTIHHMNHIHQMNNIIDQYSDVDIEQKQHRNKYSNQYKNIRNLDDSYAHITQKKSVLQRELREQQIHDILKEQNIRQSNIEFDRIQQEYDIDARRKLHLKRHSESLSRACESASGTARASTFVVEQLDTTLQQWQDALRGAYSSPSKSLKYSSPISSDENTGISPILDHDSFELDDEDCGNNTTNRSFVWKETL